MAVTITEELWHEVEVKQYKKSNSWSCFSLFRGHLRRITEVF